MLKKLFAALVVALAYVAFLAMLRTPLVQAYPVIGAAVLALVLMAVFLAVLKPAPRHRLLLSLRRLFRSRAAPIGVILLGGLALSACASLTGAGGGSQSALLDAVKTMAQDTNCGHTDRLAVNLGAISTGQIFLERNCPGPSGTPKAAATPPAQ